MWDLPSAKLPRFPKTRNPPDDLQASKAWLFICLSGITEYDSSKGNARVTFVKHVNLPHSYCSSTTETYCMAALSIISHWKP